MSTYDENTIAERTGRHPLSTGYLVAGLVFLGIATSWALRAADVIDDEGSRWILPVVLIVAGLAGLTAAVTRASRSQDRPVLPDEELPGDPDDQGQDPLAR